MQPMAREADRYETRMAYEMTKGRKKAPRRVRGLGAGQKRRSGGEIKPSAPYICNANRAALFPASRITSNGAAQQNRNSLAGIGVFGYAGRPGSGRL